MGAEFQWLKTTAQITSDLGVNRRLQLFMANECFRRMTPYVPFDSGTLSQDVRVKATPYNGMIEYLSPYSHYQWAGEGFNFSKEKHPLATAQWDRVMWAHFGDEITHSVDLARKRFAR